MSRTAAKASVPSCRPALRMVAQSICGECESAADEPCRQCMRAAPVLIGRFLRALPQGQAFMPADLAAMLKRSALDG